MTETIFKGATVSSPHIKTELPGPKARAMIAREIADGLWEA